MRQSLRKLAHHQLPQHQLTQHRIPGLLDPLPHRRIPGLLHEATRRHPKSSRVCLTASTASPVLNVQPEEGPSPEVATRSTAEGPSPEVATRSTPQLQRCGHLHRMPAAGEHVTSLTSRHRIPGMLQMHQATRRHPTGPQLSSSRYRFPGMARGMLGLRLRRMSGLPQRHPQAPFHPKPEHSAAKIGNI